MRLVRRLAREMTVVIIGSRITALGKNNEVQIEDNYGKYGKAPDPWVH